MSRILTTAAWDKNGKHIEVPLLYDGKPIVIDEIKESHCPEALDHKHWLVSEVTFKLKIPFFFKVKRCMYCDFSKQL